MSIELWAKEWKTNKTRKTDHGKYNCTWEGGRFNGSLKLTPALPAFVPATQACLFITCFLQSPHQIHYNSLFKIQPKEHELPLGWFINPFLWVMSLHKSWEDGCHSRLDSWH